MKYQAIIFDLFGTLTEHTSQRAYRDVVLSMASSLGAPGHDLWRLWLDSGDIRVGGHIGTMEAYLRSICGMISLRPDRDRIAAAVLLHRSFSRDILSPRPDAVSTLTRLNDLGFKLGLISDCPPDVPALWPETPFASSIESPVFSSESGHKKPNRHMYELACERLKVNPRECLYVGDGGSQELTGALAVGMNPVLLKASSQQEDLYRPGAEEWDGPTISALEEVLDLVG